MKIFAPDLVRSLAIGFAIGAAGLFIAVGLPFDTAAMAAALA